jgi:hypothetical protein
MDALVLVMEALIDRSGNISKLPVFLSLRYVCA